MGKRMDVMSAILPVLTRGKEKFTVCKLPLSQISERKRSREDISHNCSHLKLYFFEVQPLGILAELIFK